MRRTSLASVWIYVTRRLEVEASKLNRDQWGDAEAISLLLGRLPFLASDSALFLQNKQQIVIILGILFGAWRTELSLYNQ